jgi:hypothetical protein
LRLCKETVRGGRARFGVDSSLMEVALQSRISTEASALGIRPKPFSCFGNSTIAYVHDRAVSKCVDKENTTLL